MFKIYRQEGADSAILDVVRTPHPVEAEEAYLRLCQIRTPGPGAVYLHTDLPGVVDAGAFRTDERWVGSREQEQKRWLQQWVTPEEGGVGPTVIQVAALGRVAGLSGSRVGALLGTTSRAWRMWISEKSPQRIPWAAWFALAVLTGLHPEFGRRPGSE